MTKKGKRIRNAYKVIDKNELYDVDAAINLIKDSAKAKFDESIDLSLRLNLDPRKSDQNIRGMMSLPHGNGKTIRVCVFAKDDKIKQALDAGADIAGGEDLIEEIKAGRLDFERCIATPDIMPLIGKISRILGPKGLMPNPKLGTVTADVVAAVKAAKGGQVEYRAEKAGIIHAGVGKASFSKEKLKDNIKLFVDTLSKSRPGSVKGTYILGLSLNSSMGPGVRVDVKSIA